MYSTVLKETHVSTTIVWFRDDLRTTDNPALSWAAERGDVLGVVIDGDSDRPLGRAAKWWRWRSVSSLSEKLPLMVERGDPREIIPRLARGCDAEVVWNRRYHSTEMDAQIKEAVGARSFPSFLLAEPWEVTTDAGTPYRVFTPFFKAMQSRLLQQPPAPLPAPKVAQGHKLIDDIPPPTWTFPLAEHNTTGEDAALEHFHSFLDRSA